MAYGWAKWENWRRYGTSTIKFMNLGKVTMNENQTIQSWCFMGVSRCFQHFPEFWAPIFFSPRVWEIACLGICRFKICQGTNRAWTSSSHHHTIRISGRDIASIATSIWIAITSSWNYVKTIPCEKKHTVSICPKLDARPFWGRIHHFSEFLTISIKYATYTVSTYDMLDFGTIYDMYGTASTGGHSQAMKW